MKKKPMDVVQLVRECAQAHLDDAGDWFAGTADASLDPKQGWSLSVKATKPVVAEETFSLKMARNPEKLAYIDHEFRRPTLASDAYDAISESLGPWIEGMRQHLSPSRLVLAEVATIGAEQYRLNRRRAVPE